MAKRHHHAYGAATSPTYAYCISSKHTFTGVVQLCFVVFRSLSKECSGYYVYGKCLYSVPAGDVIEGVSYVFFFFFCFGKTAFAQWVPGVKRPGRGVDHPPPSSAEVKEREELYLCSPLGLHGLF
jgi:hypothetical protein